jgi:hypothetical protein
MAQVIQCLPSKHEALSLSSITTKNKQQQKNPQIIIIRKLKDELTSE